MLIVAMARAAGNLAVHLSCPQRWDKAVLGGLEKGRPVLYVSDLLLRHSKPLEIVLDHLPQDLEGGLEVALKTSSHMFSA